MQCRIAITTRTSRKRVSMQKGLPLRNICFTTNWCFVSSVASFVCIHHCVFQGHHHHHHHQVSTSFITSYYIMQIYFNKAMIIRAVMDFPHFLSLSLSLSRSLALYCLPLHLLCHLLFAVPWL